MKYSDEQKTEAKKQYLQGAKIPEIEKLLGIPRRTIYLWCKAEMWGEMLNGQSSLYVAHRRLQKAIDKEDKTNQDLKEINTLINAIERLERLEEKKRKAAEPAENSEGSSRTKSKKKKNNDFRGISSTEIMKHFEDGLFAYQLELWAVRDERIRNILKSRQVGLTYYFAREAFTDALLTGKNKIFLSASRAQADMFRQYIREFSREWFGIDVKGSDRIELITDNGVAVLHFLSTNTATAQSYHGDLYVDEYFWIPRYKKLSKVASGMASQKRWTKTYFSTPSTKSHEAYPFWSGDEFNERMKASNKPVIKFPTMKELKNGQRCPDGQYRRVINILDAEEKGCDLFDIEQLKLEYSEADFKQLFMCAFIDDTASVFKFSQLENCLVESADWKDFKPNSPTPYKGRVWIGYDPSRSIDGACIVVIAPPDKIRGKFRVLEKITLKNQAWQYQAAVIKDLCDKYNVEYIGIDKTGPGAGVFEQVQEFFRRAEGIFYTLEKKTNLVLKAQDVINSGRIEWDVSHSDIAAGFMQIRRTTTGSGCITYVADRSDVTGHADAAWAIMHALINEGLTTPNRQRKSSFAVSSAA